MAVVTYVDPDSVHNPSSGTAAPATWFQTHEANFRSIIGRVAARIYSSVTQDFNPNTTTTLTLGSVDFNNGMTTSTANTIIVPSSYDGKYVLSGQARFTNTTAGAWTVTMNILVNGSSVFSESVGHGGSSGVYTTIAATTVYPLSVGDAVTLSVTTSATNPTDTDTEVAGSYPSLSAFWLSA